MTVAPSSPTRFRAGWLVPFAFGLWAFFWCAGWEPESDLARRVCRLCGYASVLALLVPYLHVVRNLVWGHRRSRRVLRLGGRAVWFPGHQSAWLRAHVAAAFAAFVLACVHSRGRANGWLTALILVLFWAVMLSGTIGYWGRPLVYRLLRLATRAEYGRARIRALERTRIGRRVARVRRERWQLIEHDVLNWPEFCRQLDEAGSLPAKVWVSATRLKGTDEAERVVKLANRGDRLPAVQMNPVIGVLNQWLVHKNSVKKVEEYAPPAGATGAEHERHARLYDTARLLTEVLGVIEQLESKLAALAKKFDAKAQEEVVRLFESVRGTVWVTSEVGQQIVRLRDSLFPVNVTDPVPADRTGAAQEEIKRLAEDYRGRRNRVCLEIASPHVAESGTDVDQPLPPALDAFYKEFVCPLEVGAVPGVRLPAWGWLFTSAAWEPVAAGRVAAVRALLAPRDTRLLDRWLVYLDRSRQLDVEEWFDRLANVWVRFHALVAAVLFVLVADHVFGSVLFGGY